MLKSIKKNHNFFNRSIELAKVFINKEQYEFAIEFIKQIAFFATFNQTGYFVSWELEKLLDEISSKIEIDNSKEKKKEIKRENSKLKILHVVSEIYPTGGHTKLMKNWIINDFENSHSIVNTSMSEKIFKKVLNNHNIVNKNYTLKGSVKEKSKQLRELAYKFDKIILHIHQFDIIPNLAFSCSILKNRIIFLNHSDHTFWLGVSISKVIAQIRENNIGKDKFRRGIDIGQCYLPIPIFPVKKINEQKKKELKIKFGFSNDITVLLTIAPVNKFKPYKNKNFFKDIIEILNENKNLVLIVIGVTGKEHFIIEHPQIKFLGILESIQDFEFIADIYIENYPLSSFTSMLQAMNNKVPVHLMYNPHDCIRFFSKNNKDFKYSKNVTEWKNNLKLLIKNFNNERETLIKKQDNYLYKNNLPKEWSIKLKEVYNFNKYALKAKKDVNFFTEDEVFMSQYLGGGDKFTLKKIIKNTSLKEIFSHWLFFYYLFILKISTKN